jgi:hypothetical protein
VELSRTPLHCWCIANALLLHCCWTAGVRKAILHHAVIANRDGHASLRAI